MEKTQPKVTPLRRQNYVEEVASRWAHRDLCGQRTLKQAVSSFKLAIFCAQFVGEPSRTVGGLCLHLAWLYREMGDQQNERRFMQNAMDFYIDCYEHDSRLNDEGKMPYLIGELARRLGDDKLAVLYFNQVIQDKTAAQKYIKLARDQWAILREDRQNKGLQQLNEDGEESDNHAKAANA